ncbi:Crp/Fnr family transcriptional regulator [Roseateles cavernae]|uniref:Crp/Fnr family transcriptional regulator n=1 Tax=Roseateles cavernae TaxID=3153578 RepID=UPI0032E47810
MSYMLDHLIGMGVPPVHAAAAMREILVRTFQPSETLAGRGDTAAWLYHLADGLVMGCVQTDLGLQALHLHGREDWFNAPAGHFDAPLPTDLVALTCTTAFLVPVSLYSHLLNTEPAFARRMLDLVAFRGYRLVDMMLAFKHGTPAFRIAYTLGHLAESIQAGPTGESSLEASLAVSSQLCGVSRTILTDMVARLVKADLLQHHYGRLVFKQGRTVWVSFMHQLRECEFMPVQLSASEAVAMLVAVRSGSRLRDIAGAGHVHLGSLRNATT